MSAFDLLVDCIKDAAKERDELAAALEQKDVQIEDLEETLFKIMDLADKALAPANAPSALEQAQQEIDASAEVRKSLSRSIDMRDKRIEQLEAALEKYGEHLPECTKKQLFCDCGLLTVRRSAGDSEPGSTKQRLDMLDQFEEAERIAEHVSNLTKTDGDGSNG